MTLKELSDRIAEMHAEDVRLSFIVRALKPGVNRRAHVIDKYDFKIYHVDVTVEIQRFLYDTISQQIARLIAREEQEFLDYNIVTDETERLFSYQCKGKRIMFADAINKQLLGASPAIVTGVTSLVAQGDIWASCVELQPHEENAHRILAFHKIQPAKVAINQKTNPEHDILKKFVVTCFNTTSKKLEFLSNETITLDRLIDCLYCDETFYILQKANFEIMVNLAEEYQNTANEVTSELAQSNMIEGIDLLRKAVAVPNAQIHKKLARIARSGTYKNLDQSGIQKIIETAKQFNLDLVMANGRLLLRDAKDVDTLVKVLCDYFKTGEYSGKAYGTYAGREVKQQSSN